MSRTRTPSSGVGSSGSRTARQTEYQLFQLLNVSLSQSLGRGQARQEEEIQTSAWRPTRSSAAFETVVAGGKRCAHPPYRAPSVQELPCGTATRCRVQRPAAQAFS